MPVAIIKATGQEPSVTALRTWLPPRGLRMQPERLGYIGATSRHCLAKRHPRWFAGDRVHLESDDNHLGRLDGTRNDVDKHIR